MNFIVFLSLELNNPERKLIRIDRLTGRIDQPELQRVRCAAMGIGNANMRGQGLGPDHHWVAFLQSLHRRRNIEHLCVGDTVRVNRHIRRHQRRVYCLRSSHIAPS
jgi:hypothetical protein